MKRELANTDKKSICKSVLESLIKVIQLEEGMDQTPTYSFIFILKTYLRYQAISCNSGWEMGVPSPT